MIRTQSVITKTILAILCASLVLPTGCSGAHASNKQEMNSGEVSGDAQKVSETAGDTQDETDASADAPQSAGETELVAEVPPMVETVNNEYTQKTVPVNREKTLDEPLPAADQKDASVETVQLRFYKDAPNVAYMGIAEYFDLMLGGGLNVQDHGDGTYTLTNAAGAAANVDVGRDTVSAENMPAFVNYYEAAKKGTASSFKDSAAPYLKLREVIYEGEPAETEFNLGKLGIEIRRMVPGFHTVFLDDRYRAE